MKVVREFFASWSGLPVQGRRRQGALEQFARYVWLFKVTPAGWYLAGGTLLVAVLAISSLEIPVFYLFDALCGLFFIAFCAGWFFSQKVRVSGQSPGKTTAGEAVTATVTVQNTSRKPIYDLLAGYQGLPRGVEVIGGGEGLHELAPASAGHLSIVLRPLRRGLYEMPPLKVSTTFPFGLFRTEIGRLPSHPLLVLPSFHALSSLNIPFGARYQPGGIALTSNIGESPEYIGNRDYRPGDATRRIDFRSWGRLGRPVVREYQEEYYCRVALVLDTFVPDRRVPPEGFLQLEGAISLAAAVADVLARGEHIIDIFAAGPELHVFRAGRHTAHFENILEILASVDRCRNNPFQSIAPALSDELGNISAVICVLLDWDPTRELLVQAAREAGCSVKVLIVRDGETTLPVDDSEGFFHVAPADISRGGVDTI